LLRFRQAAGLIIALLFVCFCFTPQMRTYFSLPGNQKIVVGQSSSINLNLPGNLNEKIEMIVLGPSRSVFASPQDPPVVINKSAGGYHILALRPGEADIQIKLLGYIPLKSIKVQSVAPRRVVVGGHSIGVMLKSNGIMVVGFAPVTGSDGSKQYPARDQGVEIGDLVFKVNGQPVSSETDLATIIDKASNNNEQIRLQIKRHSKTLNMEVKPVYCPETQRNRIGLFVRDGVVGVGTMTFWEPDTKQYAALGHIIIDADTRQGIDVLRGRIISASIQTIRPGRPGKPGEKIGVFNEKGMIEGNISKNSNAGIFGQTTGEVSNPLFQYLLEVGYAHQIHTGKAKIYTVVNGDDIQAFDIEIEKVYRDRQNGKGMVLRVTDPRLISLTGGIVQGMSGSPIVQDNRIIGAVTHVFLNDPERGYGIFMDSMLSELPSSITETNKISTTP
jgi:stage IV sporulation protein B